VGGVEGASGGGWIVRRLLQRDCLGMRKRDIVLKERSAFEGVEEVVVGGGGMLLDERDRSVVVTIVSSGTWWTIFGPVVVDG
jgi:hypothetical protein